jgi:hypothetical protein
MSHDVSYFSCLKPDELCSGHEETFRDQAFESQESPSFDVFDDNFDF